MGNQHRHWLLMALLFFGIVQIAPAQNGSLTGQIRDENKEAMSFAHVLLLRQQDSVLVKGVTSDGQGKFQLENIPLGTYLLNISILGYGHYFEEVRLETAEPLDVGIIQLTKASEQLEGVEVTGKKRTHSGTKSWSKPSF
ncbi:MAG: carboxypeptidase-like regulatory domain-containing protein [Pricia sp.]